MQSGFFIGTRIVILSATITNTKSQFVQDVVSSSSYTTRISDIALFKLWNSDSYAEAPSSATTQQPMVVKMKLSKAANKTEYVSEKTHQQ